METQVENHDYSYFDNSHIQETYTDQDEASDQSPSGHVITEESEKEIPGSSIHENVASDRDLTSHVSQDNPTSDNSVISQTDGSQDLDPNNTEDDVDDHNHDTSSAKQQQQPQQTFSTHSLQMVPMQNIMNAPPPEHMRHMFPFFPGIPNLGHQAHPFPPHPYFPPPHMTGAIPVAPHLHSGITMVPTPPPNTMPGNVPEDIVPGSGDSKYVDITPFLALPQSEAAKKLNIPTSTLSKRWKEAVRVRKWPYRSVCKLDKEIMTLLHNIPHEADFNDRLPPDIEKDLADLLRKRQDELKPVIIRL